MKSQEAFGKRSGPWYEALPCCCGFFFMLWIIPLLFIFVYSAQPKLVCLIVLLMLLAGLTPMIFHHGEIVKSFDSSGAYLSMVMTVSFIIAAASGLRTYYAHAEPMAALQSMRTYTNVYPQQPGLVFNDAAYLQFASTTSVDVSRSSSFKSLSSGFYTFCVAPIVDSQNAGRVEFWAVGVDCCGAAGDFQCDSVSEPGAQKGWVMRDVGENDILYSSLGKFLAPPETRRDIFLQATRKAEGLHEITTGKEPVMVRWTNKSEDELIDSQWLSLGAVIGIDFVYLSLLAIVLTILYERFTSFHRVHDRLAQASIKPHQPSIHTAKILDFFQQASVMERIALQPIHFTDVFLMSMVLPCATLLSCLFFWSFAYCSRFGGFIMAPFLAILFVLVSVLLMTPHRCVQGTFILLVALVGTFIGVYNWDNNMFHYCSVESHRSYSNVFPEADALEYQDAGKLHFQESAIIANKWSVGFKQDGVTYCVAPITSVDSCSKRSNSSDISADDSSAEALGDAAEDATSLVELKAKRSHKESNFMAKRTHAHLTLLGDSTSSGRNVAGHGHRSRSRYSPSCDSSSPMPTQIDFWAVGTNCCNPSGDFWCSNVEDTAARSAVVVYAFQGQTADSRNPWKQYQRAVWKATDSFDLPHPDHPILLKWGNDVDELSNEWLSKAIGVLLLTSTVGLLAILAFAMTSFFIAKRQRNEKMKLLQRQLEANRGIAKGRSVRLQEDEEDPSEESKTSCCSFWLILFVFITIFGAAAVVFAAFTMDVWFLAAAVLLMLAGFYCMVFVGGDPCLLEALREKVNALHTQNMRLQTHNRELKVKLKNLAQVSGEVERLQEKLTEQTESADHMLSELSKLETSKTVASALSHFFRADRDGNARIDGKEAALFISGFTLLKNLVPNFDYKKLQRHVEKHGMTLSEFSVLLSTIVADDPADCRRKLENLCRGEQDTRKGGKKVRGGIKLEEDAEDVDMTASMSESAREQHLEPWVLGPLRIYGVEHAIFVAAFTAALLLCIPNGMEGGPGIGCALLACALTGYLTFYGKLVVIVRALKTEHTEYRMENDRLQASNDQLGSDTARLVRLQHGLEVLQNEHQGNVGNAQKLLTGYRSHTVQMTVDALAELFDTADANNDNSIDEKEAKRFYDMIEEAFTGVPTFDANNMRKIRQIFTRHGGRITYDQLPELVDIILGEAR